VAGLGDDGFAGMFIPGMLPIGFAEFLCAGFFFLLDAALRRCIPDIFIPGMLIPGMLPMSCFFAACFFRVAFLFFGDATLDCAFGFFIPGMLDISCCARTGTLATKRNIPRTNDQTLICKRKFIALTFIIIPLRKPDQRKEVFRWKDSFGRIKTLGCLLEKTSRRAFSASGIRNARRD